MPKFLTDLELKLRIFILIAVAIVIALASTTLFIFDKAKRAQNDFIEDHLAHVMLIQVVDHLIENIAAVNRAYLLTGNSRYLIEINSSRNEFIKLSGELKVHIKDVNGQTLLTDIERAAEDHFASIQKIAALRKSGVPIKKLTDYFETEIAPKKNNISYSIKKFSQGEEQDFNRAKALLDKENNTGFIFLAGGGFFSVLCVVILYAAFSKTLSLKQKTDEALRLSEEVLKQVVRVAGLGIFDHDQRAGKIYWSLEMCEICSWGADEPKSLADFFNLIPADERQAVIEAVERAHNPEGDGLFGVECRLVKNSKVRWVKVKAQTFFETTGVGRAGGRVPVRTLGAVLDITAAKEREGALAKEKFKLERSNQELEQFAGVAAHDIRSPVKTISSWADILDELLPSPRSEKIEQALTIIQKNAKKAEDLVENVLQIARVGTTILNITYVDLNQILNEVLAALQPEIQQTKALIHKMPLPSVQGNVTYLESVFKNLLQNALIYRHKSRTPEIQIGYTEQDGHYEFFVKDNGIGLEPQFKGRVFEMFKRLHSEKEYPGNGIGLAFCKKVIELSGGNIWVDSLPDKGSTFYFTYPKKWEEKI